MSVSNNTRYVAQSGVIAAVYAALTLLMLQTPLGYGPVQFRLSEAVTVVALYTPAAIPGLCLGTVLANLMMVSQFGAVAFLDVVFGGLGTLLGALWMWKARKRRGVALLGPVVANALIVPAYLPFVLGGATGFYTIPFTGLDVSRSWTLMYLFGVAAVGLGQAVVVFGLGLPLASALERLGLPRTLSFDGGE